MRALFFLLFVCSPLHARALLVGAISDLNGEECQVKYPKGSVRAFGDLLSRNAVDHLIMSGDAVHGECPRYSGEGSYAEIVRAMWTEFDRVFFSPAFAARGVRPILAPGNHDAPFVREGGKETFRAENAGFREFWNSKRDSLGVLPLRIEGYQDGYPYFWAYLKDNVLFIVLQSTTSDTLSNGEAQKHWLRGLLGSETAKRARTRIAFGHVPPYAVLDPEVGAKSKAILRKEQVGRSGGLMDLLLNHRVDLLVVGHSHAPYPAELTRKSDGARMKILSMPCGHSPRRLQGKAEPAPRGYALIEIGAGITIDIRDAKGVSLPLGYFPAKLSVDGELIRYERLPVESYRPL